LAVAEQITNNIRGCTIVDLVLRYMDKLRVAEKRWFFRPVSAYYSKHRGLAVASARVTAEAEAKEQKKRDTDAKKATAAAERKAKKETEAAAKAAAAGPTVSRALRFKGKEAVDAAKKLAIMQGKVSVKPKVVTAAPKIDLDGAFEEEEAENAFNTLFEPAAAAAAPAKLPNNLFSMFNEGVASPAEAVAVPPPVIVAPIAQEEEESDGEDANLLSRVATPVLVPRPATPVAAPALPAEAPGENGFDFELEESLPAAPEVGGPQVAPKPKTAVKPKGKKPAKTFNIEND